MQYLTIILTFFEVLKNKTLFDVYSVDEWLHSTFEKTLLICSLQVINYLLSISIVLFQSFYAITSCAIIDHYCAYARLKIKEFNIRIIAIIQSIFIDCLFPLGLIISVIIIPIFNVLDFKGFQWSSCCECFFDISHHYHFLLLLEIFNWDLSVIEIDITEVSHIAVIFGIKANKILIVVISFEGNGRVVVEIQVE